MNHKHAITVAALYFKELTFTGLSLHLSISIIILKKWITLSTCVHQYNTLVSYILMYCMWEIGCLLNTNVTNTVSHRDQKEKSAYVTCRNEDTW